VAVIVVTHVSVITVVVTVVVPASQGVRAMATINVPAGLRRITQIVAGVDDVAYLLNPDGSAFKCPTGGNFNGSTLDVACARGHAYFVDGTPTIYYVDVLGGSFADVHVFSAGEGSLPQNGQYGPSIIAFYRDRMVLAGVGKDEQTFFMSRSGVHDDFDYGQRDEAAAVAGNVSLGANVGSPIRALIPWRDDILIFGCDRSIWRMVGDIAAGGSIQLVTDAVGVFGPHSWTTDPAGMLYFMGETDFYRMDPGGGLKNLSGLRFHQFFADLDRANDTVTVLWDTTRQGCHIFITKPAPDPGESEPVSTHVWWDARTDSFWKVQIPKVYDPTCAVDFSGDTDDVRAAMLGNRAGYVQKFDDLMLTDEGTVIVSHVYFGPLLPSGDIRQAKCNGINAKMGDLPAVLADTDSFHVDWTLQAGTDPKAALVAPTETRTGSFDTDGFQKPFGLRASGSAFFLKLSNDEPGKTFAIDHISGRFLPAGRQR